MSVGISLLAFGAFPFLISGCADSSEAQCLRSGDAKICYVRDAGPAGSFDVSGLQPGSILTVSSAKYGDSSYPIDGRGKIAGKVGFINGSAQSEVLTVTGTSADGSTLTGTFDV